MTAEERAIPILPCRDIDEMVRFYVALGFVVTYQQARPNPYLCVQRGGLDLHFFGVENFEPAASMGSAIIVVPNTARLFDEFAAGLRKQFGKLPLSGIPRITRPRAKQGMSGGFSVVDPGGNWLRVTAPPDREHENPGPAGVFDRVLRNAARQGDAHGDVPAAISVLLAGLLRHPDASDLDRVPLLAYLAELYIRDDEALEAASILDAVAHLTLTDAERALVADDLLAVEELKLSLE